MPDWSSIRSQICTSGIRVSSRSVPSPGGRGDVSAAWRMDAGRYDIFIKTGPPAAAEMFSAEADGLKEIAATATVRIPAVLAQGTAASGAFVALEWLNLEATSDVSDRQLGEQLAVQLNRGN